MTFEDETLLKLPHAAAWAAWLSEHHATVPAVWLAFAKRGAPEATVRQAEAIDEAVCFGWIDGQVGRLDEHFYRQRFTPRRPRSRWSEVNRLRALRLIEAGRMQPAGLAEYAAAEADGRLDAAYPPQSQASVPDDLTAALAAHPEARAFFETLSGVRRYRMLYRLHHVTDPVRRAERIAEYVELLGRRQSLGPD